MKVFTKIGLITMEIKPILEERGSRYGKFKNNAEVSQYLKFTIKSAFNSNNHKIYDYHYEALDNICQKMARIANGDPNYEDNWVDIIGYSQLALNEIRNNKTTTGSLKV